MPFLHDMHVHSTISAVLLYEENKKNFCERNNTYFWYPKVSSNQTHKKCKYFIQRSRNKINRNENQLSAILQNMLWLVYSRSFPKISGIFLQLLMQQLKDDICYYKLVLGYRNSCILHFLFRYKHSWYFMS